MNMWLYLLGPLQAHCELRLEYASQLFDNGTVLAWISADKKEEDRLQPLAGLTTAPSHKEIDFASHSPDHGTFNR